MAASILRTTIWAVLTVISSLMLLIRQSFRCHVMITRHMASHNQRIFQTLGENQPMDGVLIIVKIVQQTWRRSIIIRSLLTSSQC
jgi:hypothetical protein